MEITVESVRFDTNFIWILKKDSNIAVVDPGKADIVNQYINKNNVSLKSILVTHNHSDHIDGLPDLYFPTLKIFGPDYEPIQYINFHCHENQEITVLGETFKVLFTPGHTSGHISYYGANKLFCGDVLFSGGCGRIFEGSAQTMYYSIQKCIAFPPETEIYCGHEYTLDNLKFAKMIEPKNQDIDTYISKVNGLINQNRGSLPTTIEQELKVNPFLRCKEEAVKQAAEKRVNRALKTPIEVFSVLRHWKNIL